MNEKKYQIGMIGCGQISDLHAQRLLEDGRADLVALYDFQESQSKRIAEKFCPDATVHSSYESLVQQDSLDGVIICSPTAFHYEQVLACHEQGLSVLCEKPLVDSRERILELIDLFQSGNPFLSVAYQRRYWSSYQTLRREVQSGKWGKILAVTAHNVEAWQQTITGTWRDDPQKNKGGFLGDPGSHKIDAIFYVTGLEPTQVYAVCDHCGSNVEIQASVSARLSNGSLLNMSLIGNAQYLGEDFHVHCEKADWMYRHGTVYLGLLDKFEPYTDLVPKSNPDTGFLDILAGKIENPAPVECALPVFDFTEAILKSAEMNKMTDV